MTNLTLVLVYISVDLAHHEIFCAKVAREGISVQNMCVRDLTQMSKI